MDLEPMRLRATGSQRNLLVSARWMIGWSRWNLRLKRLGLPQQLTGTMHGLKDPGQPTIHGRLPNRPEPIRTVLRNNDAWNDRGLYIGKTPRPGQP